MYKAEVLTSLLSEYGLFFELERQGALGDVIRLNHDISIGAPGS